MTNLSFGNSERRWCKNRLIDVAQSGELPWLRIIDPQRPTFAIGVVPVGFYRGEPDRPHSRTLKQSHLELAQQTLAFGDETSRIATWRIATPLDFDGKPTEVAFVGFNAGGQQEVYWPIPVEARAPTLRVVSRPTDPPTGIGRPEVRVRDVQVKSDDTEKGGE